MPTGTKGGYDKARESFAKDKGSSNGIFGRGGDAVDRIVNNAVSGIGNLFSGGNRNSGSSASQRPQARPEYLVKGTGRDAVYTNTRTGETAAAPDYSPFSFKGLTSSDPGNYMRNQEAVQRYNAMPQQEQRGGGGAGIASLLAPLAEPTMAGAMSPYGYTLPASLVAPPTSVPGPVEVPTMGYTGGPAMGAIPAGYGSAFAGLSQPMANPYAGINLMDIFSMYPDLRYM